MLALTAGTVDVKLIPDCMAAVTPTFRRGGGSWEGYVLCNALGVNNDRRRLPDPSQQAVSAFSRVNCCWL